MASNRYRHLSLKSTLKFIHLILLNDDEYTIKATSKINEGKQLLESGLGSVNIDERARQLLGKVKERKEEAGNCGLTFDEVAWAVQKHRSRDDSLAAGQAFLTLPKLTVFSVGQDALFGSLSLMKKHRFDPRDAIHASVAMLNSCSTIVSDDTHLDRLKEIPRRPI